MDVQLRHGGGLRPLNLNLRWGGIALAVTAALLLGGVTGAIGRHYLNAGEVKPLPGITKIVAQPIPTVGPGTDPTPVALPDHVLLQVPFTTQAPLNNWDRHQESCEAANLTMLYLYWNHNGSVVIDPHAADSWIGTIDAWKPAPDLNDTQVGELAKQHWGYSYRLVPNDPNVARLRLTLLAMGNKPDEVLKYLRTLPEETAAQKKMKAQLALGSKQPAAIVAGVVLIGLGLSWFLRNPGDRVHRTEAGAARDEGREGAYGVH